MQTRIDTRLWIDKSKTYKTAIGKAWSKKNYAEVIPGVNVDNPCFVTACKET
jgi:hypothetical protein